MMAMAGNQEAVANNQEAATAPPPEPNMEMM
jgi:hypothetical protein